MKNLLKAILVVLFLGILITSFATSNINNNSKDQIQLNSAINKFEEDIKSGNIVQDGILNSSDEIETTKSGNFIANIFSSIGKAIVSLISAILKFFSSILQKFIG